ncbi:MAG: SDR family NAD(P)-dependent oxidoreductase [Halobacteriales archaeon]
MATDRFAIAGDAAIVTGASQGIGEAIARRFATEGVDVAVCSREHDHVQPVADAITSADGGDAIAVECDVTDRPAVEALVERTVDAFDGLDILVNNAGASFMAGFDDISPNGWQTIVDINLTGTYHCTNAAADALKDGGGVVINLASAAGLEGSPYMSHYGAAKAGVINVTASLGNEWAADGVRVNGIAPGFVATPGVAQQMGVTAEEIDRSEVDRRIGTVEEIADIAQFLASQASSYLVGETIVARGTPLVGELTGG